MSTAAELAAHTAEMYKSLHGSPDDWWMQRWPKEKTFQLLAKARKSPLCTLGPEATAIFKSAKTDFDIFRAVRAGAEFMIDNYDNLEKYGFVPMPHTGEPLPYGVIEEKAKTLTIDCGDGTSEVVYCSLHVCNLKWKQMMDVYWDKRVDQDTLARNYHGKVLHEDANKRLYHSLIHTPCKSHGPHMDTIDNADILIIGDKKKWRDGEIATTMGCLSPCMMEGGRNEDGEIIERMKGGIFGGSAMQDAQGPGARPGTSDIWCLGHAAVNADPADPHSVLCALIPMAAAVGKQIQFAIEGA